MLAQSAPLPFTGSIGFLAAARGDSTHALVSLSLAAGALKFGREGDGYRADYRVTITLARGGATVARVDVVEPVRVATLRETRRADESVLFQQVLTVPPGQYTMSLNVRDEGSGLGSSQELSVPVPAFGDGAIAAPLAYYEVVPRISRDSLPRLVASPRAAATFGADSAITVYVETYGSESPARLMLDVRVDGQMVWSDSVATTRGEGLTTAIARIPVSRIGIGAAALQVWHAGGNDTVRAPIFVGLGDELPITTYQDMLSYLRYFTTAERLAQLQGLTPALRSEGWAAFSRETDPLPATAENEALTDYLVRLRRANERFLGEGTAGWRTDRGMVLLLLGEPDQITDQTQPNDLSQRGRSQSWEYRALGYSVDFVFVASTSQWRLASATEAQVRAAARRRANPRPNPKD
jgi:GWxTD domain-containing protein